MNHLAKKVKSSTAAVGGNAASTDIKDFFEGELMVWTSDVASANQPWARWHKSLILAMDVPTAPLFKDAATGFIPQEALFTLLNKYDSESQHEQITKTGEAREVKRYAIKSLPPYLVMVVKRFKHNNYFVEKNPTIVNFPLKELDLRMYLNETEQRACEKMM